MRGSVTFEAIGQTFELRFTTNAICRLEERTGKPLDAVLDDAAKPGKRTLSYRLLIWATVAGISIEEAGDIMDALGPKEVDRILAEGMRLAFPPKDQSEEGNGVAPD